MKRSFLFWWFFTSALFQLHSGTATVATAQSARTLSSSEITSSPPSEDTVILPGPLRSFLRMAGISQSVSPPEVLPFLAHGISLRGYQGERPTEFLILLRRYYRQAKELSALAGSDGNIRLNGCEHAEPLLRVLGYRIRGECGRPAMALVAANPEKAFLTIDSGFPLVNLEQALQRTHEFVYPYQGSIVPSLFSPLDWIAAVTGKTEKSEDLAEVLMHDPVEAQLYWALSQIEPATRAILKKDVGLMTLLPFASVLNLYGSQICIRSGRVMVPGGGQAEKQWQDLAGADPGAPAEFVVHLLGKDHGWLAAYFDALARSSQTQQEHFAAGERLKHFYTAFHSAGTSHGAAASTAFRPAPALTVLAARMQWDSHGDPYVPGNLQVWHQVIHPSTRRGIIREWGKRSPEWSRADQLAKALFALARQETDGPVRAYLCLSELDRRRPPERRLGDQAVALLVAKYSDFSDQYWIFSEFPELNDRSVTLFLNTAGAIDKIPDHSLRGNTMGMFQSSVGLWQILARQGQIARARLNSSWQEVIEPFGKLSTSGQLLTAGRKSVERLMWAASGKESRSQDEMIDLLAGAHQTSAEARRTHGEIADRIRSVLEDQQLVSIDTLFALDDGLKEAVPRGSHDALVALASELRDFEMPQPIFSSGEHYRWAAGTYNNGHTEAEMRTDLAKVLQSPSSPAQREQARGQLATFLRDTLVGMNYAYYEPPGSQALHHNPLLVRSHDFSGQTVIGVEHLWQAAELFAVGSPAGGGAHLIGSLADLPYVLAETEQDFIAPSHVQALIWQQFVPGLLANAVVPRWWDVSRNELHAVALYQTAGEELMTAASGNEELREKLMPLLSDRMVPGRQAWLEQVIRSGRTQEMLDGITPSDAFYLASEFRQRFPAEFAALSAAARKLETLSNQDPDAVKEERLSRDFGVIHPVLAQTYARGFSDMRPFPLLSGNYSRLMGECWDSGNLYWARLADDMGYPPVLLNRLVPELTRRMVEKIAASEIDDWPAILRALRETGEDVRQGKISPVSGITARLVPGKE